MVAIQADGLRTTNTVYPLYGKWVVNVTTAGTVQLRLRIRSTSGSGTGTLVAGSVMSYALCN